MWELTGEFVTHVGVRFVSFSESNKCIHCHDNSIEDDI